MRYLFLLFLLLSSIPAFSQSTVQYAASLSQADAERIAQGYAGAYVVPAVVNGRQYYRVQVRYASPAEAARMKKRGFIVADAVKAVLVKPVPPKPVAVKPSVAPPALKLAPQPIAAPIRLPVAKPPRLAAVVITQYAPAPQIAWSIPSDVPPQQPSANAFPSRQVKSQSYQLLVPKMWKEQTVTYQECSEGRLFLPSAGGAAMQVFVLGEKILKSPDRMLIDYVVGVMSQLAGVQVLATEPVQEGNRLQFELKLQRQLIGRGIVIRNPGSGLLFWAISRPDEMEVNGPLIESAIKSIRF